MKHVASDVIVQFRIDPSEVELDPTPLPEAPLFGTNTSANKTKVSPNHPAIARRLNPTQRAMTLTS